MSKRRNAKTTTAKQLGTYGGSVKFIGPGLLNGRNAIAIFPRSSWAPNQNSLALVHFLDSDLASPGFEQVLEGQNLDRRRQIDEKAKETGESDFIAALDVHEPNAICGAWGRGWHRISTKLIRVTRPFQV